MAKWLIHFKDGKTLTDSDCAPHEIEVMEKHGYTPDDITSVERIIRGKHLTIKKSHLIDTFFVGTEEGIDMKMGSRHQAPPIVTQRILGCYIKDSDPPIQARLIMDPRTFDARLHIYEVRKKTLVGINAKPVKVIKKGAIREEYTKGFDYGNRYSIVKTPVIKSYYNTPHGLSILLKKPKIRVEMVLRSQNVLVGFMQPDQKLKIEFPE